MLHKSVIIVVVSVLVVGLIHGQFSEFAQGKPSSGTSFDCKVADFISEICCWWEDFGEGEGRYSSYVCQECVDRDGYPGYEDCGPLKKTDTREVPSGPLAPLQGGVLGQLQNDQPPLFGRNEAAIPPTGGIEQPFTSTPFQQIPQGTVQGQVQPFIQSETSPTLSPLPTPPPPLPPPTQAGPTVAPQDSQDDEGGGLPTIERDESPSLDNEITSEDEGQQEDSSEGEETAGPLT